MKMTPMREEKPAHMADRQVQSAEAMMESGKSLSRGQRKRLQKKEKFVNQKFLENKHSQE